MFITTYQHARAFLDRAQLTLQQHIIANSLLLGVSTRLLTMPQPVLPQPYLATVEDANGLLVAACMTPPYNIIVWASETASDAALALVVESLASSAWHVVGVVGQASVSQRFATQWQRGTGQKVHTGVRQRLFELAKVVPPRPAPGRLRLATENDIELVGQWIAAFYKEAMENVNTPPDTRQVAATRIRRKEIRVWELPDGSVVAMAGTSRPIGENSTITVALVYTPPVYRGKGYASNCVAALSQHLLDVGWQSCNLFTDLANPISNSIYQKIGYTPVGDYNVYDFA